MLTGNVHTNILNAELRGTLLVALLLLLPCEAFATVWVPWVTVDDPGNPPDLVHTDPWDSHRADDGWWNTIPVAGHVGYTFEIAETPISVAEYAEFLNAIAADDPHHVISGIHRSFSKQVFYWPAVIIRSGEPGSYTYEGTPGWENHTAAVHPYSAMRFANWMHNGQPTGPQGPATTESGAYDCVNGRVKTPPADCVFPHMPGARFRLPTLSEAHKAGFWNKETQVYHHWPTRRGVEDDQPQWSGDDTPVSCSPYAEPGDPYGAPGPLPPCRDEDRGNQVNRSGHAWCGSDQTNPIDGTLWAVGCENLPIGSYPETQTPFGALDFCGAYPVLTEQAGESGGLQDLDRIIGHPTGWWGHPVGDCEADKVTDVELRTWTGSLTGLQMQIRLVRPVPEASGRASSYGALCLAAGLAAWRRHLCSRLLGSSVDNSKR